MSRFPHRVPGLSVSDKSGVLSLSFTSLDAALMQSEAPASPDWRGNKSSRKPRSGGGWSGSETFAQALDFGRYGWKEGREKIVAGQISLRELSEGMASARSEDRDVYGSRPDVPLYCAGAPEHMVVPGDLFGAAAPFVDLVVSAAVSSGVSADKIINYGAALASLVDQTEAENRRVRVTIFFGITGDPVDMHIFVRVKDHGEPLDIDRLAFALACPAMFRRIVFALIEQVRGEDWYSGMRWGYGRPKRGVDHANAIVVPSAENWKGQSDWSTPKSAYETMKSALEAELNGVADEGEQS